MKWLRKTEQLQDTIAILAIAGNQARNAKNGIAKVGVVSSNLIARSSFHSVFLGSKPPHRGGLHSLATSLLPAVRAGAMRTFLVSNFVYGIGASYRACDYSRFILMSQGHSWSGHMSSSSSASSKFSISLRIAARLSSGVACNARTALLWLR